jgi:hypothetical protein
LLAWCNHQLAPRVYGAAFFVTVLRFSLRPYLACLLLLCFVRVLLPEAWVLALHPHQHTTEEPAQRASLTATVKGKHLLTSKHTHCHEESLYDAAFQPAAPVVVPSPVCLARVGLLTPFAASVWAEAVAAQRCLRGPPLS